MLAYSDSGATEGLFLPRLPQQPVRAEPSLDPITQSAVS